MRSGERNGNEVEQRGDTHGNLQDGGSGGGLGPFYSSWWKETSNGWARGEEGERQHGGERGDSLNKRKWGRKSAYKIKHSGHAVYSPMHDDQTAQSSDSLVSFATIYHSCPQPWHIEDPSFPQ